MATDPRPSTPPPRRRASSRTPPPAPRKPGPRHFPSFEIPIRPRNPTPDSASRRRPSSPSPPPSPLSSSSDEMKRPASLTELEDRHSKRPRLSRSDHGGWARPVDEGDLKHDDTEAELKEEKIKPKRAGLRLPKTRTCRGDTEETTEKRDGEDDDSDDNENPFAVHQFLYPDFHPVPASNETGSSSQQQEADSKASDCDYKDPTDKFAMSKREIDEAYGRIFSTDWSEEGTFTSVDTLEDLKKQGLITPTTRKRKPKHVQTLDECKAADRINYAQAFTMYDDGTSVLDAVPGLWKLYPHTWQGPWHDAYRPRHPRITDIRRIEAPQVAAPEQPEPPPR